MKTPSGFCPGASRERPRSPEHVFMLRAAEKAGHFVLFRSNILAGLVVLLLFGGAGCRLVMDIPDGPPAPAVCGDGVRQQGEACDGEDLAGQTCTDHGHLAGVLSCKSDCTFDTALCFTGDDCGDGVVQVGGLEECDGEDFAGASCESLGLGSGVLACTAQCMRDTDGCAPSTCGNGQVDAPAEDCEGADLNGATCGTLGYLGGGELGCSSTCKFDQSGCVSVCGNEVIEPDETCDPGSRQHPGCSPDCQVNPGWECAGEPSVCVSTCGDGIITSAEDCEGSDLNGQDCTTWGLGYGQLTCGDDCIFDTTGCRAVTAISAGDRHTCALMDGGAAYCWGDGDAGQLGVGNYADSNLPVRVSSQDPMNRITASAAHSCAVAVDAGGTRRVHCWGDNFSGQLGDGSNTSSTLPLQVSEPSSATVDMLVSAHADFTCSAIVSDKAFCWGNNSEGQLGTGNYENYRTPRQVQTLGSVTDIVTGVNHACAISAGSLHCWGANGFGQLGIGETGSPRNRPEMVSVTNGARRISAGTYFTCAVSYSNHPHCWGNNTYGQLGTGNTMNQSSPTLVSGLTNVSDIAVGSFHACALLYDGTVRCWGANGFGQLGNGSLAESLVPVTVTGLSGVYALSAGAFHTCALLSDGTMRCWGSNFYGQLGDQSNLDSTAPVLVRF